MTTYEDDEFKTIEEIVREEFDLEDLLHIDKTKEELETESYFRFEKNISKDLEYIYTQYANEYGDYGFLDNIKDGHFGLIDIIYNYIVKQYDVDVVFENEKLKRHLYDKLTKE